MSEGDFQSLDPDPDPDEFRELGYRVVDLMAEHYAQIQDIDNFPDTTPPEVTDLFDDPLPREGQDPEDVIDEWEERVYPYAAHPGSPRWFGYVQGSGTPMGALADALAASVNMNAGGWIAGPSATEIERQCIRWLAEMIDYHTDCGGILTSGGTMANHTAIYAALQSTTDFEARESGLRAQAHHGRFTLYESAHEGHSSVGRVAEMIGVGSDAIRMVPCDDEYRMDPDALDTMLSEDIENGHVPFCVVANVGSINVSAIADICDKHDVWMHADGACGAVGAILPEKEHLYEGLDQADSVTLDPHKWFSIPYSCGCVLFRDPKVQARSFSMEAEYLDVTEKEDYQGTNFGFLGPEMSRPFRALKLWMNLKHRGIEGYRQLLRKSCRCAEYLHDRVVEADDFETVQTPNLFIYSFRYLPADLGHENEHSVNQAAIDEYVDWLNQRITDDLRLTGEAFVTTTEVQDQTVIRLSICSHRTTVSDIDTAFEALREYGERIDAENR
ncbi:MAG: aspartate aminotransferase family protein, partial [Halobacteriaceae archaeon]